MSDALSVQFGWCEGKELTCSKKSENITILSTAQVLGITIGCLTGGTIMQKGRRRLIMVSNVLCIIFSLACTIKNFWIIAVSRLLFGTVAGLILAAGPTVIEETVPSHLIDKGFGTSTNMAANFGVMFSTVLAVGNPDNTNYDALKESTYWRFIMFFPVITCTMSLMLLMMIHR